MGEGEGEGVRWMKREAERVGEGLDKAIVCVFMCVRACIFTS